MTVARNVSAAAETMTGANIRKTKGFDSPPVKDTRKASWKRSNSNVSIAFLSDKRLLAGKMAVTTMLNATETPNALAQRSSLRSISRKRVAIIIAPNWPAIASQRKSISVRRRSHLLRAVLLKRFKGVSNIIHGYQAGLARPIENAIAALVGFAFGHARSGRLLRR